MLPVFDELADAMQCDPVLFAHANDEEAIQYLKSYRNMTIVGYPSFIFTRGPDNIEQLGAVDNVASLRSWLFPKLFSITNDDLIRRPQAQSNRVPLYWKKPDTCVP